MKTGSRWMRVMTAAVFLLLLASASWAGEKQPVMGAGPSTEVTQVFFRHFSKLPAAQGYEFEVEERSIKHAGGIEASGKYLFGRTGRPLNAEERAKNKREIYLAMVPIDFIVGEKTGVRNITEKQLIDIFARKIINWKELGGADQKIVIAGREPTEAGWTVLKDEYPEMAQVTFDQVLQRDHQVVNFMDSPGGAYALAFGFRGNFDPKKVLEVKGHRAGSNCGLVYDASNADHPLVKAVIEYARSDVWRKIAIEHKFLVPTKKW